jgi:hypothetical protein
MDDQRRRDALGKIAFNAKTAGICYNLVKSLSGYINCRSPFRELK